MVLKPSETLFASPPQPSSTPHCHSCPLEPVTRNITPYTIILSYSHCHLKHRGLTPTPELSRYERQTKGNHGSCFHVTENQPRGGRPQTVHYYRDICFFIILRLEDTPAPHHVSLISRSSSLSTTCHHCTPDACDTITTSTYLLPRPATCYCD